MHFLLYDMPHLRLALQPFSFIRPLSELQLGLTTIREKWSRFISGTSLVITDPYLHTSFDLPKESYLFINSAIIPNQDIASRISLLKPNERLVQGEEVLAFNSSIINQYPICLQKEKFIDVNYEPPVKLLSGLYDLIKYHEFALTEDYLYLTDSRTSRPINDPYTNVYHSSKVYVAEEALIKSAIINAEQGPVYIGKGVIIGEGAVLKGPILLGEGVQVSPGAIIKGPVSIGKYSKVGGEIQRSLFYNYSNKVHDGFIGHSVIGSWCNLGAGTTTSNLRNDYQQVNLWSYVSEEMIPIFNQFCGSFIGDYSKFGIHTMLNTGTVVGVHANVFGSGFCDKFIPSFTWGNSKERGAVYELTKAFVTTERIMERRGEQFTEKDKKILSNVFKKTASFRIKYNQQ